MSDGKLYKVLRVRMNLREGTLRVEPSMMSTNYSDYLPMRGNPGRWTRAVKNPRRCISGWHLTTDPRSLIRKDNIDENYMGARREFTVIFRAEGRGGNAEDKFQDKKCFKQIRLLYEVKRTNWPKEWLEAAGGAYAVAFNDGYDTAKRGGFRKS